jgi:pyruvate,water dikinase
MLCTHDTGPVLRSCRGSGDPGLARAEFIITNHIGIHPMALARYPNIKDPQVAKEIAARPGLEDARAFFVTRLSEGIARIAAAFYPKPVIVRTSDFKTNEYAQLLGGQEFEPAEENPMIGFRGASRYYDTRYADGFALECQALHRARREMGLTNIKVMIPFCRTVDEDKRVIAALAANGLVQGLEGLEILLRRYGSPPRKALRRQRRSWDDVKMAAG